jgi:hypothetical protein
VFPPSIHHQNKDHNNLIVTEQLNINKDLFNQLNYRIHQKENNVAVTMKLPNEKYGPISTPRLNTLLYFHLVPINLIISQGAHNDS